MKKGISLFVFLMSSYMSSLIYSNEISADLVTLRITCLVKNQGKKTSNVELSVYKENRLFNTVCTNKQGLVEIDIQKDGIYTLMVTSGQFYAKKVQINTKGSQESKYRFHDLFMVLDLNNDYLVEGNFEDVLDFPFGVFVYERQKDRFICCKKYIRRMRRHEIEASAQKGKRIHRIF